MEHTIESILLNTKEAYKESILIDNDKIQGLLLKALTSIQTLTDIDLTKTSLQTKEKQSKRRYTYEQVKMITKVQIELANNNIDEKTAEEKILQIADFFPIHNIKSYTKRFNSYLNGIGSYGFAMPTNWAKALLEETNNSKKVLQALSQQQKLYMEKDGTNNSRLTKLISDTLASM